MKNSQWMNNLEKLGEWMAYGFYEAEDEPRPMAYGRAWRCLYENMTIRIPEGRSLIPFEPFCDSENMETSNLWFATALICDFNHHQGLRINGNIAEQRKREFPELADFIDELCADLSPRFIHHGGYTHSNPDIRRVVNEGFLAMVDELDREIEVVKASGKEDELNFLLALKDYTEGVKAFHSRTLQALKDAAEAARGKEQARLKTIASAFANAFLWKAETFLEGLLGVHFTWMLDACDSIGRFDQALGELFERDINSGALSLEFARELLDELWENFERFNAWNMQIGGRRPDGADGCNMLTKECILTCERNKFRRPNVAFRITEDSPDCMIIDALKALKNGSGRPALYNDDLYIKNLLSLNLGLNENDAREIGFGGCTETMIAGMSNVGSLEGTINLAKALELALNDGFDPIENKQSGPHTGAFKNFRTFDDFFYAVKRQIQFMTDAFVGWDHRELDWRMKEGDPKLYRSFFTRDCVKNHKSFEHGGARYNWAVLTYQGIANTIDSLAAIEKLVFQEKSVSASELHKALQADFNGQEALRKQLLAAPKFGNDLAEVDELGQELLSYAWSELCSHSTPRGGRYIASCILFVTYLQAGKTVGATPDGRFAGTALADSVGAFAGRDQHGPTALLNSVCKMPLGLAAGTPVLNIRLRKDLLENEDGLMKTVGMIRTYFRQGGMQLQISVLDSEEMRAAQKNPEEHGDLIVRIGGYSEYFNRLAKELQDTVIARSEINI